MRYDEAFLKLVKEKTLEALLSDDDIMDKLVFKGGNAIAMIYRILLMYGKEASNRKQEIDRQHYTIPNQRPKDKHCGKI